MKALLLPNLVFLGFGACATMAQQAPEAAPVLTCDDPAAECVEIYTSVFSGDAIMRRAQERVGPLDFFPGQEPTCEEVSRARKELLRSGKAGEAPACD
jgi:hypothetical protein